MTLKKIGDWYCEVSEEIIIFANQMVLRILLYILMAFWACCQSFGMSVQKCDILGDGIFVYHHSLSEACDEPVLDEDSPVRAAISGNWRPYVQNFRVSGRRISMAGGPVYLFGTKSVYDRLKVRTRLICRVLPSFSVVPFRYLIWVRKLII